MKTQKHTKGVLTTVITLVVIAALFMVGPAQAISFSINGDLTAGQVGTVTFEVNLDRPTDVIPDNASLKVFVEDTECWFTLAQLRNGNTVSCADGEIALSSSLQLGSFFPGFGYGYGYSSFLMQYEWFNSTITGYGIGYGYGYSYSTGSERIVLTYTFTPAQAGEMTFGIQLGTDATHTSYFSHFTSLTVNQAPPTGGSGSDTTGGGSTTGGGTTGGTSPGASGVTIITGDQARTVGASFGIENAIEVRVTQATESQERRALLDALERVPEAARQAIQDILDRNPTTVPVNKVVEVLNIRNSQNQVTVLTRVRIDVSSITEPIEIVEILPKDIIGSASMVNSNIPFTILSNNPVIQWNINPGQTSAVEYWVSGSHPQLASETYAVRTAAQTSPSTGDTTQPDTTSPGDVQPPSTQPSAPQDDSRSTAWLWIIVLVALAAVAVGVVVMNKKR